MKRATAVHALDHLIELCATDGPPGVREVWATGSILEGEVADTGPEAVVTVDAPPEAVPWRVTPAAGEPLVSAVSGRKIHVLLVWRSAHAPVANHAIVRPALLWSAAAGRNDDVCAALLKGPLADDLRLPATPDDALREQLATEIGVSLAALERDVEQFWEPDWRRDHRGARRYPEHHLWEAVSGYLDLRRALD